jgi:oligopeptide/dipeptide ABC transporter ATP-binding protein
MVFQDPGSSLNPHRPLKKSLEEPLAAKRVPCLERKEILDRLVRETGLTDTILNRLPSKVSGGENQRICIARALSTQPDFLILDEPLTALDAVIRRQVAALLQRIKKTYKLTCFLITHDIPLVKSIGTRVGVMYLGRLVETCTKEQLFSEPAHPYTRALLSTVFTPGLWQGKRIILTGDIPSIHNPPKGCIFHTRCPQKMPQCSRQIPPDVELASGHRVCCHLYRNKGSELA